MQMRQKGVYLMHVFLTRVFIFSGSRQDIKIIMEIEFQENALAGIIQNS